LKFGRKKIGQSATEEYVLTAKYSISFVLTKINYSDFFFTLESLRCGVFILKNIDSALSPLFLGFSRTQENVGKTFFRGKKKTTTTSSDEQNSNLTNHWRLWSKLQLKKS